jgi:thioredoxin
MEKEFNMMSADNTIFVCRKCGAKNRVSQDHLQCRRCNAKLLVSERKLTVLDVSDTDFAREVLASPEPVLLMIWAPWCAYCRMLHPEIDLIASQYNDQLKVAKLNVDDNPAVCSQYTIQGVPTILMFKDGNLVDKMVGILSKEEIERRLKAVLRVNAGDAILGS